MLIHGFVSGSRVNGPGLRAVVYFQGCTLGCRDCWNPDSHPFSGDEQRVVEIAESVVSAHRERELEGVTFSGGEPMQQAAELLALIVALRDRLPQLSFGMYSGYSEKELEDGLYRSRCELSESATRDVWLRIRSHLDFAVLGRFAAERRSALALRTSANQKLALFSGRYREQDFEAQEVEIHIGAEGVVHVTGFPTAGIPA